MKISEIYPKKYANGEDLKGKPFTFTVSRVEFEALHPQPGAPAINKPVLYFAETSKGIILGPTLARQAAAILGDDTDQWPGKRITIYPEKMTVAGQLRTAIRARRAENGPSTAPAELTEERINHNVYDTRTIRRKTPGTH